MVKTHQKMRLPDENGKNDIIVEVNWNPDDAETNESKIVKFIYKDGTEAYVKREYLHSFLFLISRSEEQRELIPLKLQTVRWHESLFTVKADRDVRKGESLVFAGKLSCDQARTEETISGMEKNRRIANARKEGIQGIG